MQDHRNPQDSVPNDPPRDNFNPAEALEALHTEIVDIEAFAHAQSALACAPTKNSFGRLFAELFCRPLEQ